MSLNTSKDVLELKAQLAQLKPLIIEKKAELEASHEKFSKSDKLIADFISTQGNLIIKIDVNGKQYATRLKTVLRQQDCFFYKWIAEDLEAGREPTSFWFFDRSNKHFGTILDYCRTGVLYFENLNEEDLAELSAELNFYGMWDALKSINTKFVIISIEALNPFNKQEAIDLEQLGDVNNKGGVRVIAPFNIIFKFEKVYEIKGFEIRGFSENSKKWKSENGKNSEIFISSDGKTYTSVGKLPGDYGKEIKIVNFSKPAKGSFLKISNNSNLGIGYFKLF